MPLSMQDLATLRQADLAGGDFTKAAKAARRRAVLQQQSDEENRLTSFANTPIDTSFITPEFKAAQEEATINPIRRSFDLAGRRAFSQSLRTGAPISAGLTTLAGQESRAVGEQSAKNYLQNINTGIGIAGRRFAQNYQLAGFRENRRRYDVGIQEQRKARKQSFVNSLVGTAGELGGIGLAALFPPKAKKP